MKPEEIKTRLRDEMADLAPDRLEDLLAACDAQPQDTTPQSVPVPMPAPRRPVCNFLLTSVNLESAREIHRPPRRRK